MKTIIRIVIKEFQQFKRDPKMFGIVLVAPVIQLIFLGYAATFDLKQVDVALFNMDKSSLSRQLSEDVISSGYFNIAYDINDYNIASKLIDEGKVTFVIVIPSGFEKKIERNESAPLQLLIDASDGNKASITFGYMQGIVGQFSQKIMLEKFNHTGIKQLPAGKLEPEVRVWYNPTMHTRNFMVPGIVALILMIITTTLTSLAIVKERESGTLEQLIVTPIKPYQLILGKIIPFLILAFVGLLLVLTAMYLLFGIGVRGNLPFLLFASFLVTLLGLGLGLFVSTISKTQQQAMMASVFVILMPMIYLSGFAFPIDNMPEIIQYITYLIPLRYFITILRGVVLKGIGFTELWFDTSMLLLMSIAVLVLSAMRFRKRLE